MKSAPATSESVHSSEPALPEGYISLPLPHDEDWPLRFELPCEYSLTRESALVTSYSSRIIHFGFVLSNGLPQNNQVLRRNSINAIPFHNNSPFG